MQLGVNSTCGLFLGLLFVSTLCLGQSETGGRNVGPFEEVGRESGLDFVHFNGMTGQYRLAEVTGSGVALFDYDGDGDLDVYLVQGAMLDEDVAPEDAMVPFRNGVPRDRLFRNDTTVQEGNPLLRFVDVTESSGLNATQYGMGTAVGDYDGDGDLDLFVTNLGVDQLWRNEGNGTFVEVAVTVGISGEGWSSGAVFADYDGDGWPDLFVTRYVDVDLSRDIECYATSSRRDFCGPSAHPPTRDRLFRNRGDGTFEDVSVASGISSAAGPGLGVTADDLNGDERLDFLVANDGAPNHLWLNRGDGRFVEDGLMSGLAVNRRGQAEASMGASLADVDGDGDDDLVLTHLSGESNTYYERTGEFFEDRSLESGLAAPSQADTGFGVGWVDLELDGDLDLLVANGAVKLPESGGSQADPFPLGQLDRVAINDGHGRFETAAAPLGSLARVGRGLAVGDLEGDGDVDVLIANNSGPAVWQLNRRTSTENSGLWIGIVPGRLVEGRAVAAVVGSRVLIRRSRVGGSYLSSNDSRLLFGLASPTLEVDLVWPRDRVVWRGLPAGTYYAEAKQ